MSETEARTSADPTLRAPRPDEASKIAELLRTIEEALYGAAETTENDVRYIWGWPRFDLSRDAWLAVAGGARVGYAWVWGPREPHPEYDGSLQLRLPEFPHDAAESLLDAMERRARELSRERGLTEPSSLAVRCSSRDPALRAFLEGRGYRPIRSFFRMERPLEGAFETPRWPADVEVSTFRRGSDESDFHFTLQESFADHFRHLPETLEDWSPRAFGPDFAPDLSWIVRHQGAPVAASLNYHSQGQGWVGMLGVLRPWRRRGLATALLWQSFAAFRQAGLRVACLGVDAENAEGAVKVYEAVGMTVSRRDDLFNRTLD